MRVRPIQYGAVEHSAVAPYSTDADWDGLDGNQVSSRHTHLFTEQEVRKLRADDERRTRLAAEIAQLGNLRHQARREQPVIIIEPSSGGSREEVMGPRWTIRAATALTAFATAAVAYVVVTPHRSPAEASRPNSYAATQPTHMNEATESSTKAITSSTTPNTALHTPSPKVTPPANGVRLVAITKPKVPSTPSISPSSIASTVTPTEIMPTPLPISVTTPFTAPSSEAPMPMPSDTSPSTPPSPMPMPSSS